MASGIPRAQEFLEIAEIKQGVVVLKSGEYRVILKTTNINFSLKSETEQNAIIFAYRNFLNSLNNPLQIVIRSRELDIDFYLEKLKGYLNKQTNELLKLQTEEYIEYIKRLVEVANILDKQFFVVVPFTASEDTKQGFSKFFTSKAALLRKDFENAKIQLFQRADNISSQLSSVGIKVDRLTTRDIVQLFYDIYNPAQSISQKMNHRVEAYTSMHVTQGTKEEQEEALQGDREYDITA